MSSGFPCWMYGPNGESDVFERAEDIPAGWADAPGKAPTKPLDRDRDGQDGGSLPKAQRKPRKVKRNDDRN